MMPGIFAGAMGQGSGPPPVYATWNPADKGANITLSGGDLVASSSTLVDQTVRATIPISGKRYFECTFTPSGDNVGAGVATSTHTLSGYLGSQASGYGLYLPGNDIWQSGGIVFHGPANSTSPITVGFALDSSTRKLWVIASGDGFLGGGDPAADTSPTLTLAAGSYFPAATPSNGASAVSINAGQSPFTLWTPGGGYSGVQ